VILWGTSGDEFSYTCNDMPLCCFLVLRITATFLAYFNDLRSYRTTIKAFIFINKYVKSFKYYSYMFLLGIFF